MNVAFYVVTACAAAALLFAWGYFRRYRVTRPPVGVMSLGDVIVMLAAIIVVPLLYLWLPIWLVALLLALGIGSVLYTSLEPVLRRRWAIWLATLALLGADVWAARSVGTSDNVFFAVNNLVLVLGIVGATNLWAQSGMKARDAAILGACLALYDFVATARLPMMTDMMNRLASLPFAPLIGWSVGGGPGLVVGLGDLLLAAVFPLVMRRAYGRTAGLMALALAFAALLVMFIGLETVWADMTIPAMVVLGPLMAAQYLYWRRRTGVERTTQQYLAAP